MKQINNIVTGILSDKHFSMSVREAQKLSKVFSAKVYPVHVIETLGINPLYPMHSTDSNQSKTDDFKEHVSGLYNKHGVEHLEDPVVVMGQTYRELAKVAANHEDSLILVGRHNDGVLHKFLTSQAERIIKLADCPVWIHPHRNMSKLPATIVCAIDFSETCKRAIEMAIVVAKSCAAKVHFVHVIPESSGYIEMEGELNFYYPNDFLEREALEDSVTEILQETLGEMNFDEVEHEEHVCFGGAADRVSVLCDKLNADLLVMGVSSHSAFERMFMGSTVRWLLNKTKNDILIVK
jgi:nucleotide-binding universal stress UspA family protein